MGRLYAVQLIVSSPIFQVHGVLIPIAGLPSAISVNEHIFSVRHADCAPFMTNTRIHLWMQPQETGGLIFPTAPFPHRLGLGQRKAPNVRLLTIFLALHGRYLPTKRNVDRDGAPR